MLRTIASFAALVLLAGVARADFDLTILHTNDFHARFEPISRYDSSCPPEDNAAGACFGGWARLETAVAAARSRVENSILVDGGDQFQGTLFYTYYKGQVAAEMMNSLGYTAMTLGNHEFDDGPEVLAGFIAAVDFPILMSNGDVSLEPALRGKIEKSVVIEVGGERIGLVGLTPENTDELSSPGPNVTFSEPVAAVQAQVDRLSAEGVNKIIVLSHSGYRVELEVAARTTGVDVIVGGHSNTLLSNVHEEAEGPYPTMVGNTAVVQAYAYGKFLGELAVVFDDEGNLVSARGEPLLIDGSVAEHGETVSRVAELAVPLDALRRQVVAELAEEIGDVKERCRYRECAMGNLVADAMLGRVRDRGIEVALMNGGGIRASLDAGPVTMGEILTILPFGNTLSTFRISGATLLAALENGVSRVEEGAGRFPQVAGLAYSFDPAGAPGARVLDVRIAGPEGFAPLEPDRLYGVVSNNYLRNGGDGYAMLADAEDVYDFGPDLADVLADYLAEQGRYRPYLDGRITRN